MRIKLSQICYFTVTAEEENFRRAAKRLHIAQPALSRAIQHLEQELNVNLFERSHQRVQITEVGKHFLNDCRNIITSVELAVDNVKRFENGELGTLRVGYTDQAIAGFLPRLVEYFQSRQPGITLQLNHGVSTNQLECIKNNTLDVGFVTGPIRISNIVSHPFQQEKFVCIVYKGHRLAKRKAIRLKELAKEHFIHGPSDQWSHFYSRLLPLCLQAGFEPEIVQEAFNTAAILGLVDSGMGITILTENACTNLLPGLVYIPFEGLHATLDTVVIWKADNISGVKERFFESILSAPYSSF